MTRQEAQDVIRALYRGILRRDADGGGLEKFTEQLTSGQSATELCEEFFQSDEFLRKNAVNVWVPPGHFYSPIVNPAELLSQKAGVADGSRITLPGISIDRIKMVKFWVVLTHYFRNVPFSASAGAAQRYHFDNPAFSWADGLVLYGMLRHLQPRRMIEVGSGWSSACTIETIAGFFDRPCELTFIDPFPALLSSLIGGLSYPVTIVEDIVQNVELTVFDTLEAGDILFIDSTHVLKTGSDVHYELTEVLTRLASGVVVHIHDIFWPFEYPPDWILSENRSWNEAYGLRAFLYNNPQWEIVMFNDYMARFERQLVKATFPDFLKNTGGSIWLKKL